MARVVVVGAGMGGMACAARLAVKRHDVTVIEQSSTYGGKLGTFERDGFVFDTGPSLVTLPAVYRDLFLKTGGELEESIDLIDLEPAFGYRFPDGTTVDMPGVDFSACARALGEALGGTAAEDWNAFMRRAAQIWQVTRRPFLESPLTGLSDLLPLARNLSDVRTVAPFTSLRSLAAQYLHDPRLRMLVDRYATYTGSDPRRAPAALATVPYVEQTFGAYHVGGGVRRLADALHARTLERGVAYRFSTDVVEVLTAEAGVTGVRLADGEVVEADVVVANADATHLYRDLVHDSRARKAVASLRKATPSLSGFVLLLAVRGRTPGLRHHNVWFPQDYDAEFDAIFGDRARPVDDPTVYVCAPDDDRMRPDADHESWFVLVNAPRHGTRRERGTVDWTEPGLADSYRDHVLDVMAQRGFDVRDRLIWAETRTPADLERDTRAPGGAIYGTSSNGARAAFLRPTNRSPVPGLYLVGGSAHPGGGLPLVGMSAEIVAEMIGRA
ncbi:MAG TPA: phytoene desaturase family protein [Candidatus Nanopelagicales bacterium]|nr:phytoene desaturase family protein [Candidatus Nanopelagicales bacterium]